MENKITFAKFIDILSPCRKDPTYIFLPKLLDAFTGYRLNKGELGLESLSEDANPNTLKAKANGTRKITKDEANILLDNFDYDSLECYLNDLIANCNLNTIRNEIAHFGFRLKESLDDSEIPSVCAKLLKKIIYDLSYGRKETLPPLEYLDLKRLGEAAFKPAYFKDEALFINGEKIRASKPTLKITIPFEGELTFIKRLLDVYSEELNRTVVSYEDINGTKFESHLSRHVRCYYEALYKENAAREIFSDGEEEFEKLKTEISDAVYDCIHYKKHEDSLNRLSEAMDLVTKAQLNSSLLLRIIGFINVPTRQGILHILVEEGKIRSWVRPDE